MVSRRKLGLFLSTLGLYVGCALVIGYFGINAYTGNHGLLAKQDLDQQFAALNEELAPNIQDMMFVFNDLLEVDDRGIQEILRGISTDKLLLALKGSDERITRIAGDGLAVSSHATYRSPVWRSTAGAMASRTVYASPDLPGAAVYTICWVKVWPPSRDVDRKSRVAAGGLVEPNGTGVLTSPANT